MVILSHSLLHQKYLEVVHSNASSVCYCYNRNSFIYFIGMCRMRRFPAVIRSFFHSSPSPFILLHQTSILSSFTSSFHLFLGLPFNIFYSKFIYNTLLGILFSSILFSSILFSSILFSSIIFSSIIFSSILF